MKYNPKGYKNLIHANIPVMSWIYILTAMLLLLLSTNAFPKAADNYDKGVFRYQYLYSFETQKGKYERAHGKPRTAAVNSLDQIYVVIPYAKEVRVYSGQGEFLFAFGLKLIKGEDEKGRLSEPSGIAIDKEDMVYISDLERDMIVIFDQRGNFIMEFPLFRPAGKPDACAPFISYNPVKNLLYVPDPCNQMINIYTPTGTLVSSFGQTGTEVGRFGGPANCAFNKNGDIFVVDSGNFRVQCLGPANEPKMAFGGVGTTEKNFVRPYGIAIDSKDRIFVSDIVLKSIQVFDGNGGFMCAIKEKSANEEIFKQPLGISYSSQNRLYVVDGEGQKIHVFKIE
ncbi:NHL repeat-containing protein [bacterium]|nr:NHL repeat-containing protein [bacterium]